jgi:hypothetical protein
MTDPKAIPALRPYPLELAKTKNNALALADIPRRLSAGQAWLYGYLSGKDRLDAATPNPAPRSPMSGRPGHTHSGGMDGRALFRSLGSVPLDPGNVISSTISENGHLGVVGWSSIPISEVHEYPIVGLGQVPVVVPGCDPDAGAYQDLAIKATFAVRLATNVVAGDELVLKVRNQHPSGYGCELAAVSGFNGSVPSYHTVSSATKGTDTIRTKPGEVNVLTFSFELTTAPSAGNRTVSVELLELEFGVFET